MIRLRTYTLVALTFLLLPLPSETLAQWKKLAQFAEPISCIYFHDSTINRSIGFLGVGTNRASDIGSVWKTTDGGLNWLPSVLPAPTTNTTIVSDFTFRDSLTGWLSLTPFTQTNIYSYVTHDGGLTWSPITTTPLNSEGGFGIRFVGKTNILLMSTEYDGLIVSGDLGASWSSSPPLFGDAVGFEFFDDSNGICSTITGLYTTDAGLSWQFASIGSLGDECYQPAVFPNSNVGFAASEVIHKFYRTGDQGRSWQQTYSFPEGLTGCVRIAGGNVVIQTVVTGVLCSQDSGQTWIDLCGPSNKLDTRFWTKGDTIFAGDKSGGLWMNTTGIGSNSTPQISATSVQFAAVRCSQSKDTVITLTFFDSCNGVRGTLKRVSLTGSNAFSLSAAYDSPRQLHDDDSLLLHYSPSASGADTAALHLTFHLGWKDFDTTISLTGAGRSPKENISLVSSFTSASVSSGKTTDLLITPDKVESGKALSRIEFDLLYNGDLLTATDAVTSLAGATIVTSPLAPLFGKERGIHVVVSGIDLSLDPAVAIARVSFKTSVTDTTSTAVVISNLKLNNGDQDFADCILSADTSATTFTLTLNCGDSTLIEFLKTKRISFSAIRPNPSRDAVQLEVHSPMMVDATFELVGALGLVVRRFEHSLTLGANTIAVDTKDLASGMYLVRLSAGGTVVSQSFVKE